MKAKNGQKFARSYRYHDFSDLAGWDDTFFNFIASFEHSKGQNQGQSPKNLGFRKFEKACRKRGKNVENEERM